MIVVGVQVAVARRLALSGTLCLLFTVPRHRPNCMCGLRQEATAGVDARYSLCSSLIAIFASVGSKSSTDIQAPLGMGRRLSFSADCLAIPPTPIMAASLPRSQLQGQFHDFFRIEAGSASLAAYELMCLSVSHHGRFQPLAYDGQPFRLWRLGDSIPLFPSHVFLLRWSGNV